jgi:hypothetical protein
MYYSVPWNQKGGASFRGIRNIVLMPIERAVFLPNCIKFVKSSLVRDLNNHVFKDFYICSAIPTYS